MDTVHRQCRWSATWIALVGLLILSRLDDSVARSASHAQDCECNSIIAVHDSDHRMNVMHRHETAPNPLDFG